MDLAPDQRIETTLNPQQMVFQDETLQQFQQPQRRITDPGRKTTANFVNEKMFSEGDRYFARNIFGGDRQNWNGEGSTPSGDGSEGEEDEEDDEEDEDEDDEGDGEVEGLVVIGDNNKNNNNSGSVHSGSDQMRSDKVILQKHHSSLGSTRGLAKEGNGIHSANDIRGSSSDQLHQQARVSHYENAVTVAEPDMYYSQFLQGPDGSSLGQKEIGGENGCGFSGKDVSMSMESGESLRAILSDPITGTLMDDAILLPCGHSFGSGGMQHVIRMKACYTCSQSVSEDSVAPNLSLRSAIQAFCREEELQSYRISKKRRERFEQDKSSCGDLSMYVSRGKGVQFPFAVTDRVIIKGNKRTPLRFVGREAVVTTQCLNGWYVVKTLDNAESVKLQYRSLAKVSDSPSSNMLSKSTPSWL